MTVRILTGDVRERLRDLSANSIDCVVTSPPYWGLRDYDVEGQIGLERTLGEHLDVMVDVFREVRRVLKPRGTLWLNYGDCYAAAPNGKAAEEYRADGSDDRTFRDKPFSTVGPINGRTYYGNEEQSSRGVDRDFHDHMRPKAGPIYQPNHHGDRGERGNVFRRSSGVTAPGAIVAGGYLKPKDLCMIPNRLAIALQDDGWWVRSEIIWHKPNPMPESVYDRPTTAHEKVWLLTKSEDYFYDHEAIREETSGGAKPRKAYGPGSRMNVDRQPGSRKKPDGWDTEPGAHGTIHREGRTPRGRSTYGRHTLGDAIPADQRRPGVTPKSAPDDDPFRRSKESWHASTTEIVDTRNARNVWTIAPKPFREAHFATFPPALAERCIRAGTPKTVCGCCGADSGCGPICQTFPRKPGMVLDPFGGAGTVGLVAQQLGLDATLIELNPDYVEITERRLGLTPAAEAA